LIPFLKSNSRGVILSESACSLAKRRVSRRTPAAPALPAAINRSLETANPHGASCVPVQCVCEGRDPSTSLRMTGSQDHRDADHGDAGMLFQAGLAWLTPSACRAIVLP
jgi:hypothetical protein